MKAAVRGVPSAKELGRIHPFLQGLGAAHMKTLADCAMRIKFSAGESIFRQGEIANRFYVIHQGKVVLEAHENAVPIETLGKGEVLGWSWLFPPYTLHFAARAIEPTNAIFFYGTWLRERCETDHDFGYELIKRFSAVMIDRLQCTLCGWWMRIPQTDQVNGCA